MNIAFCQLDIVWSDPTANCARVRQLLEARPPTRGALVILPEMFATGFCLDVARTIEADPSPTRDFLAATACRHGVHLLAGMVRDAGDGRGRNEAILFSPSGQEMASFAKLHLFTPGGESEMHRAGNEVVTFPLEETTVAVFVCYDLRFPEVFRRAVRKGAEVFLVPANWPEPRIEHWICLLRARAIENQAFVVGVNRVGRDPSRNYPGRSLVVDPWGNVLLDAGNEEGVFEWDLDLAALREWRKRFPALMDMRFA
ncbi:MAG: carbon-nitrogen family hydrolase [Limisphaerales bacterium]